MRSDFDAEQEEMNRVIGEDQDREKYSSGQAEDGRKPSSKWQATS